MVLPDNQVPMFRLQAHRGMLLSALLVFVIGGLLSLYFFKEDAYCTGASRGPLTFIFTACTVFILLIGATARFWFRHLWHHRPGYRYG